MPLGKLFRRKSTGPGQDVSKCSDQSKVLAIKGGKEGGGRILSFGKHRRQSTGTAHMLSSSSTESTTRTLPEMQPPKAAQPAKTTPTPKEKKKTTTTIKKRKLNKKKKKESMKDMDDRPAISNKEDVHPSKASDMAFDERDVGEIDWSDASDSKSFGSYTSSGGSSRSWYSSRSSRRSPPRSSRSSCTNYSVATGSSRSSYSSCSYDDREDYSSYTSSEGDGSSFYDGSSPGRTSTDGRWKRDPAASPTRSKRAATLHSSRRITNTAKSKSKSEPKPRKSKNNCRTKSQREHRRQPSYTQSEDSSNDDSTHGKLLTVTEIEQRTMGDQDADRDKLRLQKMIAQLQKEAQILENKLGDRRQSASGDKRRENQRVKETKLSQQSSIKAPRHMLDGSSNHNKSPYSCFVKPSAAKSLQPPAFEPSKSPLGTPANDASNTSNDSRTRKQLEELAEKMREIGIDPEDIGIRVKTYSHIDWSVSGTSMAEAAAPEEEHPPQSPIEPCEQVPGAILDDLGAQIDIAQKKAIARLEKKIEQTMDGSTSSRAGRQSSNGSLRASTKRLQTVSDNRKDTTQGSRPNEGDWLFEHLSLKSSRTNRSTPSQTANVGLFIDSPSVRNSVRNERALERYDQKIMDPKSLFGSPLTPRSQRSISANELACHGTSGAGSASASSSSSQYTSSDQSSYDDVPINRPARNASKLSQPRGGVRPMEEKRTSYNCLNDFIEEHGAEEPEDLASKGARSLTSNRHSFKSLTQYEEETQLREKVFSKCPIRSPKSSYQSLVEYEKDTKFMNEVPKPSKGKPLGLRSARRSDRSSTDIQEGNEVPVESDERLHVQQHSPSAFSLELTLKRVPSVISVPSSGATTDGEDESAIFPPSALTASVASDVHTKRSVDPPEVRNSRPTAKPIAKDRVEDMETTLCAAEGAPISVPIQSTIQPPTGTPPALAMPPSVLESPHPQGEITPSSQIDRKIQINRTLEDPLKSDDNNGRAIEDTWLDKKEKKTRKTTELNRGRTKSLSLTQSSKNNSGDKSKSMQLSKERQKSNYKSSFETSKSHSDERLRKLSSRKEEKEKVLQKLLRSESLSSSECLRPRRGNSKTTKSSSLFLSEHGALHVSSKHEKKSIRPTHCTSLRGFENSEHHKSSREALRNKQSTRSLSAEVIGKGGKSKTSSRHGERSAESHLCSSSKKEKICVESRHSTAARGRGLRERKSSGQKDREKAESIPKSPRELDLESLCTSKGKQSRDRSGQGFGKDKKKTNSSKSRKKSHKPESPRGRDKGVGKKIKRESSKKGFHEFTIAIAIQDEGAKAEKSRDTKHRSKLRSSQR